MAYLGIDPNKEQEDQVGMNVINPTDPNAQTGSQQGAQAPQTASQPAPAAPAGQGSQPQQSGSNRRSEGGKGSSGSFTNIRKYIDANKPQAQKMASAVGKDTQKAAQNIGQQVQQQKEQLASRIGQNRQQLQQAQQFGQQALQKAQQGQGLSSEDVQRFRGLATGEESYGQVDPLNLAKQQVAAQRLQGQAQRATTEQGRRELLGETFGDQGKQYTRGQQGLDELILGGSEQARQQLAQQTTGAAQQAREAVRGAEIQSARDIAQLGQEQTALQEGLQQEAEGGATGVVSELDKQIEAAKQLREQQLQQLAEAQTGFKQKLGQEFGTGIQGLLDQYNKAYSTYENVGTGESIADQVARAEASKELFGQALTDTQSFLKGDQAKLVADVLGLDYGSEFMDKWAGTGDLSLFDTASGLGTKFGPEGADLRYRAIKDVLSDLNKRVGGVSQDVLDKYAMRQLGGDTSLEDFRSGADLTREAFASPEQFAKYSALSQLAGTAGGDLIEQNVRDRVTEEEFADLLGRLS